MERYRFEIVEEVTRVAVIETDDVASDGTYQSALLDLVEDVAMSASTERRRVRVTRADATATVDARF